MVATSIWGDSACYWTRDSVYLMLFSVLSGKYHKRYWVTSVSKRTVCQCGTCYGRHTFEPIWEVIGWMLQTLLRGTYPFKRHDGVPFSESKYPGDKERALLAGKPLRVRGVHIKKGGTGLG